MCDMLAGLHFDQIGGTLLYSFIGILVFVAAYGIVEKITPFSVKDELVKNKNMALAIVVGSVMIGLSIIISSAIR